ncbi:MAG TPA: hypothetical protein EYH30_03270 [Anaerolineales bacterium]|nr:hypothetical protein [Anaerolineae bacterium]HIQ01140.1 hypothetical protein [Anaerolineales bacterium]
MSVNEGFPRWFRWALVTVCLIAGFLMRVWHLTAVPPGFHVDEAIDVHLSQKVLLGEFFVYSPEGWGREGLHYYLEAVVLSLTRNGILGGRLTTALIGMVLVGVAGFLTSRLFDADTGVLTAVWTSLTFWPVFASRVGVRNITLAPVLGLAMLAFWWAWRTPPDPKRRHLARFGLAGLLGGICLYTHQSSRVIPLVYGLFLLHASLFQRRVLKANWRGLLLGGCIFLVVVLPLGIYFYQHPGAEGPERAAAIEPLWQLLAGDPRPMAGNLLAVLKMFTIRGDPLFTYNIPGRPVFPGLAALPFYLGAILLLRHWRDPAHALTGVWLGVMLIPTLITVSAPLFLRSTGALIPVMAIPALGLGVAVRFAARRWGRWGVWAGCLLTLLLLGQTGWLTWRDYFGQWASLEQVEINYHARETAVVEYLRREAEGTPVVVGSRFSEDAAPFIVSTAFLGDPPPVRWVLPSSALAFPSGQAAIPFVLVANTSVDEYLLRHFLVGDPAPTEPAYGPAEEPWLLVAPLSRPAEGSPLPGMERPQVGPWFGPPTTELPESPADGLLPAYLPVKFQNNLALLQYGLSSHSLRAGGGLRLVTLWRVLSDGWPGNLAMFVHLVNLHNQIVAQQDQFGYPTHSWRAGDLVIQIHDLTVDPSAPPGRYWLQVGFYERHLPGRWKVTDLFGEVTSDRLLLDQVEVQP